MGRGRATQADGADGFHHVLVGRAGDVCEAVARDAPLAWLDASRLSSHAARLRHLLSVAHAGHVWGTYKGLEVLERGREAVKALDNTVIFSLDALRGAANCTQAERKLNLVGMKKLLEEVARRGYAPFKDFDDARVMLGSESNVLAVVMESVAGISVPDSAFTRSVYAATPASQGMRLMLANALKCEEGDDKEQPLQ